MFHQLRERFKGNWSAADQFNTIIRLVCMFLRGCWHRIFLKKTSGLVLVGKGAQILYAKYVSAGKDLIIEDYAEVNGLAKEGIRFGNRVTIGKFAIIRPANRYGGECGEGLIVGDHSNIGPYNYIGCSGKIEIGNNVMLSPRVSIYAENHVFENVNQLMKDQGVKRSFVKIEDDCWIAANSVILAGVTIGRGSVVAAGSVVTKDVPPYSVVAGVPAKVIKSRRQ